MRNKLSRLDAVHAGTPHISLEPFWSYPTKAPVLAFDQQLSICNKKFMPL